MAYGRQFNIVVNTPSGDTFTINDGECDFSCVRDSDPQPNEAVLTLWGITADTQNKIAVSGSVLSISAGYQDEGTFTLFQGELHSAVTVKPAEVYGLRIKIYEGLIPYRSTITSRAFNKGESLAASVRSVAADMGLGCQISAGAQSLQLARSVSGVALSRDVLNSLCKPVNAAWHIQYQTLIVTAGDATADSTVLFSPESGLLGTPKLKLHTPRRHKATNRTGKTITTYPWPPKGAQADYGANARRQVGTVEGLLWDTILYGGVALGESVRVESPSLGGWSVIPSKITHRFGTRDVSVWQSSFEGVVK